MIRKSKLTIIAIISVLALVGTTLLPLAASAQSTTTTTPSRSTGTTVPAPSGNLNTSFCSGVDLSLDQQTACNNAGANDSINNAVKLGLNLFSAIVGIISVVMIIIGGIRYITSGGDSGKVTSAQNTVLYAVIGLIVVSLAQVIVKFVLGRFTQP